jgi:hypothetical protein
VEFLIELFEFPIYGVFITVLGDITLVTLSSARLEPLLVTLIHLIRKTSTHALLFLHLSEKTILNAKENR